MLSCSFIKDKQATDTVRVPQEVDPWVHLSVSVNNAGANRIDGQTCNDTYLLVGHAGWRWRGSRRENAGEGWGRSLEPSMFVWPSGKLGQGGH